MKARCFRLAMVALLTILSGVTAADAVRPPSVVLILDCSQSMAEGAASGGRDTRWQVAQNLLQSFLRDLATTSHGRVGVYCLGHRVKWEDDSEQPNLLEQERYLEASLGFAALRSLVPGDDVERVLALRPFAEQDLAVLQPKLVALEPWGERPLHLAIVKALDDFVTEPGTANRRIIVLTDGGNQQRLSQVPVGQDQVLAEMRKALVPIHVVYLGPGDESTKSTRQALQQIAEYAGGDLRLAATSDDVRLADLLVARPPAREVAAPEATDRGDKSTVTSTAPAPVEQTTRQFVSGNVVINGHPVRMATITLEGSSHSPVKVDRTGRFVFHDVPVGRYQVKVQAIVQNRIRNKTTELVVLADRAPELTVDVK